MTTVQVDLPEDLLRAASVSATTRSPASASREVAKLLAVELYRLPQRLFNEITISEDVWDEVVVKVAGLPGSAEARAGQPVLVDSYCAVSEFSAIDHLAKPVFSRRRRAFHYSSCERNTGGCGVD